MAASKHHQRDEEEIDFSEVPAAPVAADVAGETLDPDNAAVVRAIQSIIGEAIRFGASRVLILPLKQHLKVAYRVPNGVCSRPDFPAAMIHPVLAKLMTMVNLSGYIKVVTGERERKLHAAFRSTGLGLWATMEIVPDPSLLESLRVKAGRVGYAFVVPGQQQIAAAVLETVPRAVAHDNGILPLSLDGEMLTLAMSGPPSPETLDRLRFTLNRPLAVALAPEGMLRVAIDAAYGASDPELLAPEFWETAAEPETEPAPSSSAEPSAGSASPERLAAEPLIVQLRTGLREKMFELFESIRSSARLCRLEAATGDLEVVFPQSHLVSSMPAATRQYLENKIWVLRDAILSRLENFLEQDTVARCLAMAYSQYLAGRQWAEGQRVSINAATGRDAWINFVYSLAVRSFPAVDSNGALLAFLTEHLDQLSAKVASLAVAADLVVDPGSSHGWLTRLASQTTTDEMLDFDSSPIIHLMELLIAEALHVRASVMVILPLEDRVEVAYRVQNAVYAGQSLPLGRLGPLLARLRMLADSAGELKVTVGNKERRLRVALLTTDQGMAARLEVMPDAAAIETCKAQAAELGYPLVQLGDVKIPPSLLKLLPKAVAWKKKVLPLGVQDGKLRVVLGTPPTKRRQDELRLIFNHLITVAMSPDDEILAAIYRHYHPATAQTAASPLALSMLGLGSSEPGRVGPDAAGTLTMPR
jgi:type II secretory ATPase GspE/PulE/Tfp pilus assembly ATPase PilB-like protein